MVFSVARKRKQCRDLINYIEPYCIIGTPSCTAFTILQEWNRDRLGEERFHDMFRRATRHMEFCCDLYMRQLKLGRHFVHEHPDKATSWGLDCIQGLLRQPGVAVVTFDMCQFGMWQLDSNGPALVRKRTKVMSSSKFVIRALDRQCPGGHRHIQLLQDRARHAQVHPIELSKAIIGAIMEQKSYDEEAMGPRFLGRARGRE